MKILMRNYHYVRTLDDLLAGGYGYNSPVVHFLEMVIRGGMWKERFVPEIGRKVTFNNFGEFIQAKRPEGLGTTLERLQTLSASNKGVLQLIERAVNGNGNGRAKNRFAKKT